MLIGAGKRPDKARLGQLSHDVMAIDTAVYCMDNYNLSLTDFITEKQLHKQDGFANRKHRPDFVMSYKGVSICVEVELTNKAKDRVIANIKDNYTTYDKQLWIIPTRMMRTKNILSQSGYTDIYILESVVITNYIEKRKGG